ncbi:MAG TPA: MFS transporter [Terriglobia bacterium]|nr:MFS transporter [Terriglobia bacterium]
MALPQWRKNQIAVTISSAFLNFGYTLVMSFLPIYVRELGVQSTGGIAFWSGLILSASPLMASLVGPLWGRLGDRKGMRMIAARATAANAVFWALMALAQNVWQLLLLRIVLGLLGGFTTVAVALVTQLAPKEKVPSIIGTLQSVQILSTALGPFFGGILATSIGVRNTFIVTGIMNFGSLLSILLLYADEDVSTPPETISAEKGTESAAGFWKQPEYFTALMILFFVNMADRTFGPIIPLFLEELGTPRVGLEMVAGVLISASAFGEALSAWLSGKLASRVSLRRLITGRLVLSILVLVPMVFVHSTEQFSILRVFLALLAGGTLTLALSAAHRVIPEEYRGTGFATLSGASMLGGAAGPIISGAIAGFSIRSIFVFNSVVYLLMIGFVYRNVRH